MGMSKCLIRDDDLSQPFHVTQHYSTKRCAKLLKCGFDLTGSPSRKTGWNREIIRESPLKSSCKLCRYMQATARIRE